MRPFSNIMPNFAANLHLLVDSISLAESHKKRGKKRKKCWNVLPVSKKAVSLHRNSEERHRRHSPKGGFDIMM